MVFKSERWDELEKLRTDVEKLFESVSGDNRLSEIKSKMERIVVLDPTDKIALFWLGNFWYKFGIYEKALTYIEKVIKLDENHTSALFCKGNILTELKKEKEAL